MRNSELDRVSSEFTGLLKRKLKGHLKKIILFGSHARVDFTEASDYDFLVIVAKKTKKIQEAVLDVCVEILNKYDALIGCIVCDGEEWEKKKRFPIGRNISEEGIEL